MRVALVINATNVQSGALWRFSRPYMRDYRVGEVRPDCLIGAGCNAARRPSPISITVVLHLDPQSLP
jgi:NTE family protein